MKRGIGPTSRFSVKKIDKFSDDFDPFQRREYSLVFISRRQRLGRRISLGAIDLLFSANIFSLVSIFFSTVTFYFVFIFRCARDGCHTYIKREVQKRMLVQNAGLEFWKERARERHTLRLSGTKVGVSLNSLLIECVGGEMS